MIIRLNENKFNRIFLFEGNSSRAARQTRDVIAQFYHMDSDDQRVVNMERIFRSRYFSEGRGDDWFISLEPTAYKWLLESGPYEDYLITILSVLNTEAKNSDNRTVFMQNVKTMSFNQVGNLVGEYERGYRTTARQNKENGVPTEEPKFNPRYGKPLGPLSFDESKEYGQYSGLDAGKGGGCICYTTGTGMRAQYSNDEENKLFLLLRDDWKTVNTTHDGSEANNGLGDPYDKLNGYDEYGLSMIFVWVSPDGELAYSNTRWNHKAEYVTNDVDQAFDVTTLEKLMGVKFEEAFEVENFYDKYADPANEALVNGKPIEEVFDGVEELNDSYALVKLGKKWNIYCLKENRLYFPRWITGYRFWVSQKNNYGDLTIRNQANGNRYFFVDGNLIGYKQYLNVIENRLKNGGNIKDISDLCLYSKINKAGDLHVSELIGDDNLYFDGERFYDDVDMYLYSVDKRLENGYDPKMLFSDVYREETKNGEYYIVSFNFFNDRKFSVVVDNKLKTNILFNEYNIINGNNDFIAYDYDYDEAFYFSENEVSDRGCYAQEIKERLASGSYSLEELFSSHERNGINENLVIVGINGFTGGDWDATGYNLLNLKKGDFEFRGWYDSVRFVGIHGNNNLINRCVWVQVYDDDYDENTYYLYIDGKHTISVADFEDTMFGNAFIVKDEDGYYNLYGLKENGEFGYFLEDWANDIFIPKYVQGSCKYAIIDYGDDSQIMYYLPIINSVVDENVFIKYVNEEFEDGFGPGDFDVDWEELGDIAKIRFGGNSFNLVDLRNKPYKLMFDKNLYGEIREFPNTKFYLLDVWDDVESRMIQNVMDEYGDFLIKEEYEKPSEIKISSGGSKTYFTVRYPYGYNIIDTQGNEVFDEDKRFITRFINGYCIVNEGNSNMPYRYFIYNENLVKLNKDPFERININWFERTGEFHHS